MEYIDLKTGYMLLAFRNIKEVERARELCQVKGIQVACAKSFSDLDEQEAAGYVKHVVSEKGLMYSNYSNQTALGLCRSARESLGTAMQFLNGLLENEREYILVYEKETPLLHIPKRNQREPEAPLV